MRQVEEGGEGAEGGSHGGDAGGDVRVEEVDDGVEAGERMQLELLRRLFRAPRSRRARGRRLLRASWHWLHGRLQIETRRARRWSASGWRGGEKEIRGRGSGGLFNGGHADLGGSQLMRRREGFCVRRG